MISGDNELSALDFQKHYRLSIVHLLDPDRSFEKKYNRSGWPFLMLADTKGKIVYQGNGMVQNEMVKISKLLNKMLQDVSDVRTIKSDGISYMPATLQRSGQTDNPLRCDRFSSLAAGADGKLYLVFTTNRNRNSDIFMRIFDGKSWSKDIPIAATDADEYDSTVLVDGQGRIWVSWTSNADGKKYNIFVTTITDTTQPAVHVRVTSASDDAMHPRMACDSKGRIWMTYYKWRKIGKFSRDKEVYLRRWQGDRWSKELQISPTDVSEYEDHTDPAIAAIGETAMVCWSWDFHQPKGYTRNAERPTIFARRITDNMSLGKSIAISGKNIDMTPVITAGKDGRILYAWDSLQGRGKKLCVAGMNSAFANSAEKTVTLSKSVVNVCSPTFATSPTAPTVLIWSETKNGSRWILKRADLNANNHWSKPTTVEVTGNPRFCSAAYDSQGQLWIAYSAQTKQGREIIVKNLHKNKPRTHSNRADSDATSGNTEPINKLRQAIDEKYSYRY